MIKQKWCWMATECKGGWRLALCIGSKNINLSGLVLKTEEDIETIVNGKHGSVIFVHLKNTKFPVK